MHKKILLILVFVLGFVFISCNNEETKLETPIVETETNNTEPIETKEKNDLEELTNLINLYLASPTADYEIIENKYNNLNDSDKEAIQDLYLRFTNEVNKFKYQLLLDDVNKKLDTLSTIDISEYGKYLEELENLLSQLEEKDSKSLYQLYNYRKELYDTHIYQEWLNNIEFSINCPNEIHVNDEVSLYILCDETEVSFEYSFSNKNLFYTDEGDHLEIFGDYVGSCDITVNVVGSETSKTITITILEEIIKPTKIYFDSKKSLTIGDEYIIKYRVMPANASQEVEFSLNNDNIIIDGLNLKAVKVGSTILTIKCKDFDLSTDVTIDIFSSDVNNEISLYPNVSREMTSPYYWIDRIPNASNVIYSLEEIEKINEKALNISNCDLVDIVSVAKNSDTINGNTVLNMINSFSIGSYSINGSAMPSNYKDLVNQSCNKNAIPTTVTTEYGLINTFCSVRSFPNYDKASSYDFDKYQETALEYGEGVLIYHVSLDGKWYFVQAYNYFGWVEAKCVTKVTKEEMINFVDPNEFVIVTGEFLKLYGITYRMSTKFPYEKVISGNYQCKTVTAEGIVDLIIPVEEDVHLGYLSYTSENVLKQACKLLGNLYRWGDYEITGHDCSSTMMAIYRCFGFLMPRNGSSQQSIPLTFKSFNGLSTNKRYELLDNTLPGALVFLSGHVVMYIGKDNGTYYILHNFSNGCNITTVNIIRTGSTQYIDSFLCLVEMK